MDIKKLTLSELGVFIKSIRIKEARRKAEEISFSWMSANATKEGIEQITNSILSSIKSKEKKKDQDDKEILDNWKKLAAFGKGLK